MAASKVERDLSISPEKSTWPGVSMSVILSLSIASFAYTVMPLRLSILSKSRKEFLSSTLPIFLIAPDANNRDSDRVVLPLSTFAMIPVIRCILP